MRNSAAFKQIETALEGVDDESLRTAAVPDLREAAPEASRDLTDAFVANARRLILARRERGRVINMVADIGGVIRAAYPAAEIEAGAERVVIHLRGMPEPNAEPIGVERG